MWIPSLDQEDPWRRAWQLTPVFLPGEPPGQRSLASYSPWSRKESDMTEHTCPHHIKKNNYLLIPFLTMLGLCLQ